MMETRMAHVERLLRDHRRLLDDIAATLLEKEVIEGDDFEQMVQSVERIDVVAPAGAN
jgi:ATP-dependent Zn protease